jgi:hypothetical protein
MHVMPMSDMIPAGRNYPELFMALDEAIEALLTDSPDDLLESSFEHVADGFGAEKALMLTVAPDGTLEASSSRGLSAKEIEACEAGLSVPGISSTKIREALEKKSAVLVQDPRYLIGANVTTALEGRNFSVLCAPILSPDRSQAYAVFYAQNSGFENAFGEIDLSFIDVWARVLGRIVGGAAARD